jgi:hypothetical protein
MISAKRSMLNGRQAFIYHLALPAKLLLPPGDDLATLRPRFFSEKAVPSTLFPRFLFCQRRAGVRAAECSMRHLFAIGSLLVALSGCAAMTTTMAGQLSNPLPIPPAPRDWVWEQVVDVVDDYFEIENEERGRAVGDVVTVGRIDTFPAIGSTLLEPWKGDSANSYERLECTLQSQRRRAVVQVIPSPDGSAMVDVQVYKELEDVMQPEQAPTASATFNYTSSLQNFVEPIGGQPVPLGWIGQGRDPALEQLMLAKLALRLNRPPPAFGCKKPWWQVW